MISQPPPAPCPRRHRRPRGLARSRTGRGAHACGPGVEPRHRDPRGRSASRSRPARRPGYLGLGFVFSTDPEPGNRVPGFHGHALPDLISRPTRVSGRPSLLATVALLATTAAWGSTFFLIKDLLDRVPTLDFLAVRFAIAGLVMLRCRPRAPSPTLPRPRRPPVLGCSTASPRSCKPPAWRTPPPACPDSSPGCTSCHAAVRGAPAADPDHRAPGARSGWPPPGWACSLSTGSPSATARRSLGRRRDLRPAHRRPRRLVDARARRWACRWSSSW